MKRFVLLVVCAGAIAQPGPAFEVVSIKPVTRPTPEAIRDGTGRIGFNIDAARVEIVGFPLAPVIARAFRVQLQQVDLHNFNDTQSFEIQAKLPEGATRDQVPEMLQTMLVERFKLVHHRETREYPVTVLTVGKSGTKLQRLPADTPMASSSTRLSNGGTRFTQTGPVSSLFPVMNSFGEFPQMVDETGLEGIYTWVQELPPPSPGVTYADALQEAFRVMFDAAGLKLESRKVPKETIVVDHLEKMPTEN
jgi:uncharacterized protein (TIGR03435 family)